MKKQPTLISLIVACDNQGGIARNGSIPWNFPQELRYFSKVTSTTKKNAILMGRKTWESLPRRPLPNRVNIVLSSKPNSSGDPNSNIVFVTSIEIALEYVNQNDQIEQLFVIGGEQIYHTFMTEYSSKIDHIYYTKIQENFQCDQFFPVSLLENYTKHEISVSEPHSSSTRFTTDTDISGKRAESLPTTNSEGDLWSPEEFENQNIIYYRYDKIDIKT